MDPVKRRCSVTARVDGNTVILQVAFPLGYPNNTPPIFQFTSETNVDSSIKSKLLKVLICYRASLGVGFVSPYNIFFCYTILLRML